MLSLPLPSLLTSSSGGAVDAGGRIGGEDGLVRGGVGRSGLLRGDGSVDAGHGVSGGELATVGERCRVVERVSAALKAVCREIEGVGAVGGVQR